MNAQAVLAVLVSLAALVAGCPWVAVLLLAYVWGWAS